jgi:serine kinase of HPr protein (carbohydrate metabolism regulator)
MGRDVLYGCSHERVRDFLEIKDVGIFNVRDFLGEGAINEETVVNVMVKFEKLDHGWEMQGKETFDGVYDIMGVKLPCMNFSTDLNEERSARHIDFVTKNFSYGGRI